VEPTESADATPPFDPTRITQICDSWGGARDEQRTIRCSRGIEAVLESFGGRATHVERIYLRYTPPCIVAASCPPRRQDHAWAAVRSRLAGDLLVELEIGADGGLVASRPRVDPAPPSGPAFDSPPIARPQISDPVPAEVRDRAPLPQCGIETAGSGGPYATDARRCFLAGVLSGQPVEFITHGRGTEGEKTLTLYRFGGGGAIIRYDRDAGAWTRTACGITILTTDVVFATDGVCRRGALEAGP
jgi:hypothetical protein